MAACLLCLEKFTEKSPDQIIDLISAEGFQLNCCAIISKHFWLKPKEGSICLSCWNVVRDFHLFYQRVAVAHQHLDSKDVEIIKSKEPLEDQPPTELKSESNNEILGAFEDLSENLFDPEVKVEVNDLEFLPQVEIIESNQELTGRTLRASRRTRQSNGIETNNSKPVSSKRVKCEFFSESDNDTEPELPLSMFINSDLKTDLHTDYLGEVSTIDGKDTIEAQPQKKRRGRPPKVREPESFNDKIKNKNESKELPTLKPKVEESIETDLGDSNYHQDFVSAGNSSGTEDSSESSSDSDNSDSDSLPDVEPAECYAEIPKRVVVKPKKYRKRPKPLVPPRRMTKEELEAKRLQQEEYDKIIAKFFDKFPCPKCSLLVQNFGDMRRHFSISHNDNGGYITCCGRKFLLRKTLAEHVLVHFNPEHFKCTHCEKVLQDSRSLEIHEATHNQPQGEPKEKKLFQCDKCPKGFTTKAALEHHLISKHVPKSEYKFNCSECNKKLPTMRKLKDHIKYAHDPESAVICEKCGKQMRNQSTLKKHTQLEHSDVPRPTPVPMQCEICGTWLRHLQGLKQHMKSIHEDSAGEHRCHICNKTSTNARALKRHIYHNHECERKYKCTMCEKAFKRRQDLREHTSVHTGEVLYTCPNCPMTFFSNANMYKHRQRLHRAEWEAGRKKPVPPNIMRQAVGATAAMKMKQAIGSSSAFFAQKMGVPLPEQQATHSNVQPMIGHLETNLI